MIAKRQETRSLESQADILRAAVRVIAERGCAGATVGRIAQAAGLSTAAVFWHFKDKSGLLRAVAQHIKESWAERVKAETLAQSTGRAQLERLLANHLRWITSDDPHLRAFVLLGLESRGMGEPAAAEFVAELSGHYRAFVLSVIRQGQRDGSLSADIPAEQAATLLANFMLGSGVQHTVAGEAEDIEAVCRWLIDGMATTERD